MDLKLGDSLDMRPAKSLPYQPYERSGNPKLCGNGSLADPLSQHFSDRLHVSLFKAGPRSILSMLVAALCNHVRRVVGLGAQEKVAGVHARWIVAPMADTKTLRHRAVGQLPRNNMRVGDTFTGSSSANLAMTRGVSPTLPEPAFVRSSDICPCPQAR